MFETPDVKRQDCTVNYEWLKLPIPTDHPFYDQIVDYTNPSKTGSDVTRAIAARLGSKFRNFSHRMRIEICELWSDTFTIMELEAAWLEGSLSVGDYPTLKVLRQMKMVLLLDRAMNKTRVTHVNISNEPFI